MGTAVRYIEKCNEQESSLRYSYCMTYDEESGTSTVSYCQYFSLQGHNISRPGLIDLPDNISEFNEYMCGPMNRRVLCAVNLSIDMDKFGLILIQMKFEPIQKWLAYCTDHGH